MQSIVEAEKEIEVFDSADVVVAGGGPAGLAAAAAAAHEGADTILVERYGCLGGLATGGIVCEMDCETDHRGNDIAGGIPRSMLERLDSLGGLTFDGDKRQTNAELLKCVADETVTSAGARVLLHSFAAAAVTDGGRVTHLVTESKAGRRAVAGRVFVDATGDADLAFRADAPCDFDSKPIGLDFVLAGVDREKFGRYGREHADEYLRFYNDLIDAGGMSLSTMAYPVAGTGWIDARGPASAPGEDGKEVPISGLDPRHLTFAEIEMRRRFVKSLAAYRKHVPGYENAEVISIASQLGVRETRRVRGEYILTLADCTANRHFEDNIGLGGAWDTPGVRYGIPYRSLVPRGIDNLLVAGRCASTDHGAQEYTRVILMCAVMGEAAGTAAAIAARGDCRSRSVSIENLRATLAANGVILQ